MGLRIRNQHWHYRFYAAGRRWTGGTGLAATARNRNAALLKEAEARQLVTEGHGDQLDRTIKPFSDAADQFITWAKGEHRARPNTWKRLRASMASLREFFGNRPVHSLTAGQLQDYMSWRRAGDDKAEIAPVKEITLRHHLHALWLLFQHGAKHNWCARNPVEEVKILATKTPSESMSFPSSRKRNTSALVLPWSTNTRPRQHRRSAMLAADRWVGCSLASLPRCR